MAYKQLGPNVSQLPQAVSPGGGSFTAEDHSWECLVFQHNKPVMDWEMNLKDEIDGAYGLGQHIRKTLASGFLNGDFYESGSVGSSFSFLTPIAGNENSFLIAASDLVVNGWSIRFEYSDTSTDGWNQILLPVPPASGTDTNVVILEVWRALVVAGTTDNKSLSGQILRFGNAKAPDSGTNRNLADDLTDTTYLQETQARVQIQYRYRVVPAWDLNTYPEAPDQVVANTVPYLSASDVDGAASVYSYDRVDGDPGLWRAGAGDSASATALGTVDGYIYAVPLCAVFRRNSAAFDRATNLNGAALIAAGISDRPDGFFSDQVVAADVRDMRKGIAADFQEILARNFRYLMQNELGTEHEVTADDCSGTTVFVRDSLGAGDRQPDAIRLYFSDRAVTETVVCSVDLTVAPFTQCDIDATAIPVVWYGDVDITSLAPVGTSILEVRKVRIRISDISEEVDGLDNTNGKIYVNNIDLTATHVTLYLQEDVLYAGPLEVMVELAIGYPSGCGLDRTPNGSVALWMPTGASAWIDPSLASSTSDITRNSVDSTLWSIDNAHREIRATLKETSDTATLYASPTGDYVMLPQRLDGSQVDIDDGINPPYSTTNYTIDTAYTRIELSFAVVANTPVDVTYAATIPIPPIPAAPDSTYEVFYQSKAVQSVAVPPGSNQIKLRLRAMPSFLTISTAGSASPDDLTWPSMTGFSQIPMSDLSSDSAVDSSLEVQLPASTPVASGIASLSLKFSYFQNGEVTLVNLGDTTQDADGRRFWPRTDYDRVSFYGYPDLTSDVLRRTLFPVLMEVVSTDTNMFRPGTLVLAVFTSFDFGSQPVVSLSTSTGSGCAALYRVRGNLMNPRRLTP